MKSVQQRVHVGHTHDGLENTKTTAISQRLAIKNAFQHVSPQKTIQLSIKLSCSHCELCNSSAESSHRSSYQHQNRSSHHKHHLHPHIIFFITVQRSSSSSQYINIIFITVHKQHRSRYYLTIIYIKSRSDLPQSAPMLIFLAGSRGWRCLAEHQMSHLRLGCVSTTCPRTRECRGASAEASGALSGCLFPPTIAETQKERGESRPDLICK